MDCKECGYEYENSASCPECSYEEESQNVYTLEELDWHFSNF